MLDKDAIRSLIREVISEEVKHLRQGRLPALPAPRSVRISSDADLASFAREVLRLATDPEIRAAIEAGRYPFRLAADPSATTAPAVSAGQSHRIDVGIVTEAVIGRLPAEVKRLQLGPGVSITPLGRDKAKSRNISVERTRQ
ncbi:hypothetical protein [Rhodoligotrophos defluvii]|uniref:hypothetical protein n=1 Tax=Rhodoligotrophos defluvii TaxID=2561934 RepID=UPI0010C9E218|nr:hypothetical protein [Rhodoligotrophos defluvii]